MGLETLIASQAIGGIAGLGNSYAQSQAMLGQGRYQRDAANTNAAWAELQAEQAARRGDVEAQHLLRQARQLIGQQRVAAASQGIDAGTGSAADLQEEAAALSAADAAMIRENAFLEAIGYRSNASSLRSQGYLARRGAGYAARSSLLSGGLNFLRSAAQTGYLADRLDDTAAGGLNTAEGAANVGASLMAAGAGVPSSRPMRPF